MSDLKERNLKLEEWFNDNVVDDIEECQKVAESAIIECKKHWNIGFGDSMTVLGFYGIVFDSILEKLIEKRAKKATFEINIGNVVAVGYDDASDDGVSEKVGNFCPYIADVGKDVEYIDDPDLSTVEKCTEWTSNVIKNQRDTINQIATTAVKKLHEEINVDLGSSSAVFPLFCTIHKQLVGFMKVALADLGKSEYMINFCNRFDIYIRTLEDGETVIEYSPKPIQKLAIKSDAIATAPSEDADEE